MSKIMRIAFCMVLSTTIHLQSKENYWRQDTLKSQWEQFIGWHFVENSKDIFFPTFYCIQSNDTLLVIKKNLCHEIHNNSFYENCHLYNKINRSYLPLYCTTSLINFNRSYRWLFKEKMVSYFYDVITMDDTGFEYFVSDNIDSLWYVTFVYDMKDTINDSIYFGLTNFRIYSNKISVFGYSVGESKFSIKEKFNLQHVRGDFNYIFFYDIKDDYTYIATDNGNRFFLPCNSVCHSGFCLEFRGDSIYKIANAEFNKNRYIISKGAIESMPSNPKRQQLIEESKKWYEGEKSEFVPILDSQYRKRK